MSAIEVREVRKAYRRAARRRQFTTLKSALLSGSVLSDLAPAEVVEVLRGVSFDVAAGRTVGIIGRNGSGKSTLLKLMAGIGRPTAGTVRVAGRVAALIELGAGFHPEISGRENVYINGMMLGLSRRDVARRFDAIIAFAELEEFVDAPVKTYSSGMYMRLGFAVAIHVDPDVLLVDEVLAVGDEAFTHKCLDKFAELRRRGKTVLLVTHSLDLVSRLCDEALWLDGGVVRAQGDPKRVIDAYLLDVSAGEDAALARTRQAVSAAAAGQGVPGETPPDMFTAPDGRWGSREAEIVGVELVGANGAQHVFPSGSRVEIRIRLKVQQPLTDVVVGVGIFNANGVCCYGTNTAADGALAAELTGDAEVTFVADRLDLIAGSYKLDVAVHRQNGAPYDYHRQLYPLRIASRLRDVGVFRPPHHWKVDGAMRVTWSGPTADDAE